jgi:hypothetical protein
MKNIVYEVRSANSDALVRSGAFGGMMDQDTVDRLVNNLFDVEVTKTGRCVLVDHRGNEVRLNLRVIVAHTEKGKAAYAAWRSYMMGIENEEQLRMELDDAVDSMGLAAALARLKETPK